MNTRITIDLGDSKVATLLRMEAAREGRAIREIVTDALSGYLSYKQENRAIMKLAEDAFAEWDNPKDSEYDKL